MEVETKDVRVFSEVKYILANSSQEILDLIPEKFIYYIYEKGKENVEFNDSIPIEDQISKEAKEILAVIEYEYLTSDKEKKNINYESVADTDSEIKFNKKENVQQEESTDIIVKKETLFDKIKKIFRNIFKK